MALHQKVLSFTRAEAFISFSQITGKLRERERERERERKRETERERDVRKRVHLSFFFHLLHAGMKMIFTWPMQ